MPPDEHKYFKKNVLNLKKKKKKKDSTNNLHVLM
jgi:hypothetical protein